MGHCFVEEVSHRRRSELSSAEGGEAVQLGLLKTEELRKDGVKGQVGRRENIEEKGTIRKLSVGEKQRNSL